MKVIEKSVTPFGTEIQLEDWGDVYHDVDNYMIGAYPITDDDVLYDYEALKSGEKTLADLREHFWNKKSDCYRLGIEED